MKYVLAAIFAIMGSQAPAIAPGASVAPAYDGYLKFEAEIAAFAKRDATGGVEAGRTLFVGSSSIRMWDIKSSFPEAAAINRGFGGATTADVLHYYADVIAKYRPSSVIVYVGENDIAAGHTPEEASADVLRLLARIRTDLPDARIAYLSMKPSPSRWALWPKLEAINKAVRSESRKTGSFDYVDVVDALMTEKDVPDPRFYAADGLHLNAQGYASWTDIVDDYLDNPRPRSRGPAVASSKPAGKGSTTQ